MVAEDYIIPAREERTELKVVNSRFIASAGPAFSIAEAKEFITRIRMEFNDASHNVPAYIIGHGSSTINHCSDDGEPSGTAGRPVLAVLQGSGLGDIVIVITRYFGGTKLGTGGLVRAYSDATRSVLQTLPRARKIPTHTVSVSLPYNLFERVKRLVEANRGELLEQDFAAQAIITARFAFDDLPEFQNNLRDISRGKIQAEIITTNPETILPLTDTPAEVD
jgi:uncharacterized YigZ family protein